MNPTGEDRPRKNSFGGGGETSWPEWSHLRSARDNQRLSVG